MVDAERQRLADADGPGIPWRRWGPYLSERSGARYARPTAGAVMPGRIYRMIRRASAAIGGARTDWPVSAMSGNCSASALALWNGRDPILKERLFGLTNSEANHGEDVKE